MQDDRFDEEIKRILQDFKGQEDPSVSWSQMNDRLDQEFGATEENVEEFDESIRSRLEKYTVPVSDEDWVKLKNNLNYNEERKEKIIISKAIEIATILLLILTISKYKTLTSPAVNIDPVFLATVMESSTIDGQATEREINISSDAEYVRDILLQKNKSVKSISQERAVVSKVINSKIFNRDLTGVSQKLVFGLPQNDITPLKSIFIDIQAIESLPIVAFETKIELPDAPMVDILFALDDESNSIRDGWSIGLPVSADLNFINTSFNVSYLRSQLNNDLSGKSIGLTTSYRKGALEVETGAKYSAKRFAPGLISYTPASSRSFLLDELDEAKIKQLQIPLIAKIYANPNRNFSFYGMAGIASNIILDLDYTISKSIQANARPSSLPYVDALDLKNLPDGFAEGGGLDKNLYMTAIVGFGVQYHMTNKLGWYIQPQYQHTLTKSINEVASQINSISLEAGLKYKF